MSSNQVFHTRLGKGNRLGLPATVCQKYGLKPGMPITVNVDDSGVHLTTNQQALLLAQELFAKYVKPGESPSDELIRERRKEAKRE